MIRIEEKNKQSSPALKKLLITPPENDTEHKLQTL